MSDLIGARSQVTVPELVRLVGHELRNRLAVLSNSVYYLNLRLGKSDEKLVRHLNLISHEVMASSRILVNLMDWVGPREPLPERLHVSVLLEQLLAHHHPPADVAVTVEVAEGLPAVRADINHLERGLANLLCYEYELLAQGGELGISAHAEDRCVVVRLRDSAPGLAEEQAATLFEVLPETRFSPLQWGLALARSLLALNGCELLTAPSRDSNWRFSLLLPIA